MRIFITNHGSRFGGGISVARNLLSAFGRIAPQHEYFVTIPANLGYEEHCKTMPNCQMWANPQMNLAQRWLWETFRLPGIVHRTKPDVIFNIANRGFQSPRAPQATLVQDSHLFPQCHARERFFRSQPLSRVRRRECDRLQCKYPHLSRLRVDVRSTTRQHSRRNRYVQPLSRGF